MLKASFLRRAAVLVLLLHSWLPKSNGAYLEAAKIGAGAVDEKNFEWPSGEFGTSDLGSARELNMSSMIRLGWNEESLVLSIRCYLPAGYDPSTLNSVDVFIDTRNRNAPMDKYYPGVYHLVIQDIGAADHPAVIDRSTGKALANGTPDVACATKGTVFKDGYSIVLSVPTKLLHDWHPAADEWIGFGVRLLHTDLYTQQWFETSNMALGDGSNQPEQTPVTFALAHLNASDLRTLCPVNVRAEEVAIGRDLWLEIVTVVDPHTTPSLASDDCELQIPEIGLATPIHFENSPSRAFRYSVQWFPLRGRKFAGEELTVKECDQRHSWLKTVMVPLRVTAALAKIDEQIPDEKIDRLSSEERGRAHVLKAGAQSLAALLSSYDDGTRPLQRLAEPIFNPAVYNDRIALFTHAAEAILAGKTDPHSLRFVGWQSKIDGAWLPIKLYPPWKIEPGKKYGATLAIEGLIRGNSVTRFLEEELKASTTKPVELGESKNFKLVVYGRGNSFDELGREESGYILNQLLPSLPVDSRRVGLLGLSNGAGDALSAVLDDPEKFSWIQSRSGMFGSLSARYGMALPTIMENLRFIHVFLEAGENDEQVADFSGSLNAELVRMGIDSRMKLHPHTGHYFTPSTLPDDILGSRVPDRPNRVTFATDSLDHRSAYWLQIDGFLKYDRLAAVDGYRDHDRITVTTRNVAGFSIVVPKLDGGSPDRIRINGEDKPLDPTMEQREISFRLEGSEWRQGTVFSAQAKRPWQCGPAYKIETGPVIVVYGTKNPAITDCLRRRAFMVAKARLGINETGQCAEGRFLIKADVELTRDDVERSNLWLIGNPEENARTAELVPVDPFGAQRNFGALAPANMKDVLVSFIYPSPSHPLRYVYVERGSSEKAYLCGVMPISKFDFTIQALKPGNVVVLKSGNFNGKWELDAE